MALSVLIVEDEFIIGEDIRSALKASGYNIFGLARSYDQALDLLKKGRPDFVLLDITLNKSQSGLELGNILAHELKIPYVYVTSHSDSATLERVKLTNPSGYLLKPFKREAIYASIEVAIAGFKQSTSSDGEEPYLIIRKGEEKIRLKYSEILYLESDSNYTHVQTITARYTERKYMKDILEEAVDHPFIRIHKSYAVNRSKIRNFSREKVVIGEYEIPVGRAYYDELKQL